MVGLWAARCDYLLSAIPLAQVLTETDFKTEKESVWLYTKYDLNGKLRFIACSRRKKKR